MYSKTDEILDILKEIKYYIKLQTDILERLLQNRNNSVENNLNVISSILSSNPLFSKMGITPEHLKKVQETLNIKTNKG